MLLGALAPPVTLIDVAPELLLVIAGCAALLLGQSSRAFRSAAPAVVLGGLAAALVLLQTTREMTSIDLRSGLLFDGLAYYVRLSTLILGVIITLVAWSQPRDEERGEFFSMLAFTLTGLMLVGSAANLLVLFLALEILSIPAYLMVALSRPGPRALESGTKYFYLGALSAAITAFGFSYLYGAAGAVQMDGPGLMIALASGPDSTLYGVAVIGIVVSIAGLLFKIGAVPMHFYIADVYQGAASSISGMLGFVPKAAGMIAIIKIAAWTGWQTTEGGLFWTLWIVAALSMTVGNVLALLQSNIKRMLAYSGVAHAGYMLIGVIVGPRHDAFMGDGVSAILFYVVIYGIANLGAFAILGVLKVRGRPCETIRDVAGLLRTQPGWALLLALSMLALMGLPPTSGFWGKLGLFGSGMALAGESGNNQVWIVTLIIIAGLNSAIGAAYYLRVTAAVLLFESDETAEPADERGAQQMGAMICGFLTIAFTFLPQVLLSASHDASRDLRDARLLAVTPAAAPLARAESAQPNESPNQD